MDTREAKELAILEQYKMGELEAKSVQAWSEVYSTEYILDSYLEKQGYPFQEHLESKEKRILDQYTMKNPQEHANLAWSEFYATDDLLDDYLEKQGYQ